MADTYIDTYIVEAALPNTSPFVDKTVAELEALADGNFSVIVIIREGGQRYVPAGHWWMFADDVLVIQGDAHAIRELAEEAGLHVIGAATGPEKKDVSNLGVVEAVVMAD